MKAERSLFARILDPRFISRAISTFDRATAVIVSASWGGAVLFMLFALYALNLSATAKQQLVTAAATEPGLPTMQARPPELKEIQPLVDRLQKRFPDISFTLALDKSLAVSTSDGNKFRLWLTVLSYIDTISPQYRWKIKEFCAGLRCNGGIPMRAILVPERISFSAPNLGP